MAIVDLFWSPDWFWRTTPHEFYAAMEYARGKDHAAADQREAEYAQWLRDEWGEDPD